MISQLHKRCSAASATGQVVGAADVRRRHSEVLEAVSELADKLGTEAPDGGKAGPTGG